MTMPKALNSNKKRKSGRGVLTLVSFLFLASLAVRIADSAGPAIAREISALSQQNMADQDREICEQPPEIAQIMASLSDRETELEERMVDILEREQVLKLSRQMVEAKIAELEQAEKLLSSSIAQSEAASENDLAGLTSVYENMKPADAALLFEQMDADFAAGFIGRMRPEPAASIMTGLAPEKAYAISVILAGRNANAPQK